MSTDFNLKVFVAVNVIFTEQHSVVELKKGSVFQVLGVHAELDKQRLIVNRLVSFNSLHILGVFMCILNLQLENSCEMQSHLPKELRTH